MKTLAQDLAYQGILVRRYARILTGSQDAAVDLWTHALEGLRHDLRAGTASVRLGTFRTLSRVYNESSPAPATPLGMQAYLLAVLEAFSEADIATILDVAPARLNELLDQGAHAIQSKDADRVLILCDEIFLAEDVTVELQGYNYCVVGRSHSFRHAHELA